MEMNPSITWKGSRNSTDWRAGRELLSHVHHLLAPKPVGQRKESLLLAHIGVRQLEPHVTELNDHGIATLGRIRFPKIARVCNFANSFTRVPTSL